MKLFTCPSCSQVLYFENTRCERVRSSTRLSARTEYAELTRARRRRRAPDGPSEFVAVGAGRPNAQRVRLCRNYEEHDACNWAVPAEDDGRVLPVMRAQRRHPEPRDARVAAGVGAARDGEAPTASTAFRHSDSRSSRDRRLAAWRLPSRRARPKSRCSPATATG